MTSLLPSQTASFANGLDDYLRGIRTSDRWSYGQLEDYYAGEQPISFLHPEVAEATQGRLRTLIFNWPRLIVDSLEERLDVEGFRFGKDGAADDSLWSIWQSNDLDEWSGQCHLEAFVHGRAYAIVWTDDDGEPAISVESSQQVSVHYQPGTRVVASAVKKWVEDDLAYATLYLPDSVERYVGPKSLLTGARDVDVTRDAWELREEPISHDLGEVPVVPFVNRPRLSRPYGETELSVVIDLSDAVCKLATDMMTSSEYHAMPRRFATGVDLGGAQATERVREEIKKYWTEAAAGRFALSSNPAAKFGEFSEANLAGFVASIGLLTRQAAAQSGLPADYLGGMEQQQPASADAIRAAEATLVKRARRKQRALGGSWERVMRLALKVQGGTLPDNAESLETIWRKPETQTVAESADAAVKLVGGDVITRKQSWVDLGYSPVEQERMQAEFDARPPAPAPTAVRVDVPIEDTANEATAAPAAPPSNLLG